MVILRIFGAVFLLLCLGAMCARVQGQTLPTLPAETHPGLLFAAADIPAMKERIGRQPYATWWQTVLERAQSAPSTFTEERTKARYAKSLAFAYLMTDSVSFAAQAVEIMKDMKFPPRGGDLGEPHNEGEVVAIYAVAYDMLHQYLAVNDSTSLEEIRTILAEEAERLRKGIVIVEKDLGFLGTLKIRLHETNDPRDLSVIHLDNWHIRAYGGLGLAAYALSEHQGFGSGKEPQDWADRAYDLVTRSLEHQIEEVDGGYAEGPFYSRYAADVYLPYLFALKNRQGIDLFADPKVQKMHDWSVNLRLPNGRRPNVEDGHLDEFYGHYLAAVDEDGPVHRWDWENNSEGLYVREFSEMDAIALYDDNVIAQEPTRGPSIFMPGAGDAVFRSDWSADATYMLLRGEHGRVRRQGLGHEHPDETSFVIYAGGEMLAVDAGYINFTNHAKVYEGRNHSVILVDGEGPPLDMIQGQAVDGGNDAYIEDFFTSAAMDYAEVRANYQGVDIRRRVMFPGGEYFVIADEVRDDASHLYEWRLHGNGGGTSGGTYARTARTGGPSRWTREQAELIAFLQVREGRTFAEVDTIHSFDYLQELTHTVLQVQQSGGNVEFLAVLFPRRLDQPEPTLTAVVADGAEVVQVELGDRKDVTWILAAGTDSTNFAGSGGQTHSDGRFGFVRYEKEELRSFALQDGRFLRVAEAVILAATDSVDASLELSDGGLEGFVRGPDAGYSLSLAIDATVESLSFGGSLVDSSLADGLLTLQLAGEGDLSVTVRQAAPVAEVGAESGLDFGKVRIGTSRTLEFAVFNRGTGQLEVSSITSDDPRFTVTPQVLNVAPGDSATVAVSFVSEEEGAASGILSFVGNATITSMNVSGEGIRPLLSASADSVDLGSIRVGEQKSRPLILRNTGSDTLRVEQLTGLEAPFAVGAATVAAIAPGGSRLLTLIFSATKRGSFRDSLVVDSNGGRAVIAVLGKVTGSLLSLPDSLVFGEVQVDSAATLSLSIANPGDDLLEISSIDSDRTAFAVETDLLQVTAGETAQIEVRFVPAQEGTVEGQLTLETSAGSAVVILKGSGKTEQLTPADGVVAEVEPKSGLDFGKVRIGTSRTLEFAVFNRGTGQLEVSSITSDDPRFTVTPQVLNVAPGDSATVAVSFVSEEEGAASGILSFVGNATITSMNVSGEGIRPLLSASADSVDLGSIRVGEQKSRPLILRNTGSDTLRVEQLTGLEAPFAVGAATVAAIAPGGSRLLTLIFSATKRGSFRDSLVVDSNGGRAVIAVLGKVTGSLLSLPDSLVFGEVPVDSAATLILSIANPGDGLLEISSIGTDGTDFAVETDSLQVAAGDTARVEVRFAPGQEGAVEGRLTLETSAGSTVIILKGSGKTEQPTSAAGRADFNDSGSVDFDDFFLFADAFGQTVEGEAARFDLNDDGAVGFDDFFLFADAFGQKTGS